MLKYYFQFCNKKEREHTTIYIVFNFTQNYLSITPTLCVFFPLFFFRYIGYMEFCTSNFKRSNSINYHQTMLVFDNHVVFYSTQKMDIYIFLKIHRKWIFIVHDIQSGSSWLVLLQFGFICRATKIVTHKHLTITLRVIYLYLLNYHLSNFIATL